MVTILPLELKGARVTRRGKTLLGPVDLTIAGQGCTIIMGPNGSGKTTLLRMMHGLERPSAGQVGWALPEPATRARQAFVFQAPVMLRRNVRDNLAYPLLVQGMAKAKARDLAEVWAEKVGLQDLRHQNALSLSGGEKQKLALARALIRDPEIVFLDEPCASLDGTATREIEAILQAAIAGGTRIVMATHQIGQARRLAGEVVFLARGRIVEHTDPQSFFTAPQTAQARAFLDGDIVE
ncbi:MULTISPECIES: ATP-binding cassette domain-containing protein [unclassified Yoonia]|uniref:ATP-binding cassette domain-containing protein n=1 Tax=unclassified Yoonia TaxID=2629118 RepID=UPI002AFE296D|nr:MULTISPECIES: ATP-binding cassette domain-containing protein [unclassified Yoonia]